MKNYVAINIVIILPSLNILFAPTNYLLQITTKTQLQIKQVNKFPRNMIRKLEKSNHKTDTIFLDKTFLEKPQMENQLFRYEGFIIILRKYCN